MMSDPKIDPERMKQWEANILPNPSAERLKGKGASTSACSPIELDEDTFYQIVEKGMKAANRYKRTVRGQTLTIHDDDTY